jgi:class 3 adenylate cyclase
MMGTPPMPSDIAAELEAVRDVLRAMSRSQPDLDAVLGSACEHAVKLCGAEFGFVFVPDEMGFRMAGSYGASAQMLTYLRDQPRLPAGRRSSTGRAALSGRAEWIEDVLADSEWAMGGVQQAGDYRTSLSVPILKEGLLIGVFTVGWKEVTRFSQRLVELVETFADQAAIAIDSVRLLATIQRQREEMARFLPSTVAELIASDEGDQRLAAHRTEITAVYCDLRGFTAFTETAEPEEVLEVLREYQGEMGQIVLTHGGTLEHYAGDGIFAFLNDPQPVSEHTAEAIKMSLEMRDQFARLASRWRQSGFDLGLGIGLSVGFATVGRVGFEGYYGYAAVGSVMNLAARLCALARPGQIVVSQRVLARLQDSLIAEPLGTFELKGFSRPIEAHAVTALESSGPT